MSKSVLADKGVAAVKNIFASRRARIALAIVLAVLIVFGFWWSSFLAKMAAVAQAQLVAKANESINGKVTVERVEFSVFGTLVADKVTVSDLKDAVVGKSDRVSVRFALGDVLTGRADLSAVKSVALENAAVTLASDAEGRWNWQDMLKPRKDDKVEFRGTVAVKQGTLLVRTDGGERTLEAVNGSVDFAGYPALAFDLTAKSGATPLAVKGSWAQGGDGEVTVKADQAALADLPLGLLGAGELQLTGGTAKDVTATVSQKAGKLSLAAAGTVEKLAATVSGYKLTEGAGKVSMAGEKVVLKDASVLVNGQKLTAAGNATLGEAGLALDMELAAAAFDMSALSTPLQGPLAFQAKLTGTAAEPQARGSFTIAKGSFGAISFSNGSGNFSYGGGTLTLSDTKATAWDGRLAVQGVVVPATQQYRMTASGSGMDSELLTEKDIRGRVDFDARLSGTGSTGGYAEGDFRMGEGSFSGIPFQSLTGDFVKQGEQMSFRNIVVNTLAGSFRAEGTSEGSIVRLRRLGEAVAPREVIERAVTDKVGDLRKKLFGK